MGSAPVKDVVDPIARRAGINGERHRVEALADSADRVERTVALPGPGRALIGALKDTQRVRVRTACDSEVSASAFDRRVDNLHAGWIRGGSRRRETDRNLADRGAAMRRQPRC